MLNLAFAGGLVGWCALASNEPGLGWLLIVGWLFILVAAAVVHGCPETTPQAAIASVTSTVSKTSWVTQIAGLALVGAGAALLLLLLLPNNLSFLLDLPQRQTSLEGIEGEPAQPPITPPDSQLPERQDEASNWLGEPFLRLLIVTLIVAVAVALIWYLRGWRPKRRKGGPTADDDADVDGQEPLAAFARLETALRTTGQPRAASEAPLELSTRLPGPPYRGLRTVEEICYGPRAPDEQSRLAAAD